MKFKVTLDEEGYIKEMTQTGTSEDTVEVDLEETGIHPLFCFKVVGNEAVYDEIHYQDFLQKKEDEKEIEELKKKLLDSDYIWNVIQEGDRTQEYYADIIAQRHEWRMRIRELEGD